MADLPVIQGPILPEQILRDISRYIRPAGPGEQFHVSVTTAMNQVQADALTAVAKAQFERPAEEETKRERTRQRWETARQFMGDFKVYLALLGIAGLVAWEFSQTHQADMTLITLGVLVLGAERAGLGDVFKQILKRYKLIT